MIYALAFALNTFKNTFKNELINHKKLNTFKNKLINYKKKLWMLVEHYNKKLIFLIRNKR
jgi:hypothetical protein